MVFHILDTLVLQGQSSLISEQQESMVLTVILEMCARISNTLSTFQCNSWTEMSPRLQSFYLLSTEEGAVGESRGKRDL